MLTKKWGRIKQGSMAHAIKRIFPQFVVNFPYSVIVMEKVVVEQAGHQLQGRSQVQRRGKLKTLKEN